MKKPILKTYKKNISIRCDVCGLVGDVKLNHMQCKCGYHFRPHDDLLTSLFGKAVQIVDKNIGSKLSLSSVLPVDQMAATIIDESKWNWRWDSNNGLWISPDYVKWQTTDGIFIIKKSSQGTFDDPTWNPGKNLILQEDIALGAYHYADVYYDALESADFFANQALAIPSEFIWGTVDFPQFWLDCESRKGSGSINYSPSQLANYFQTFTDHFMLVTGYPIGIYTREIWWDDYVARNTWAHKLALWIARYNPYINEPGEPYDWQDYGKKPVLWQWSADGNGEGYKYGYHSNSIDKNRSPLLTNTEVEAIVYPNITPPPPSDLPYELEIKNPATGEMKLYRQQG